MIMSFLYNGKPYEFDDERMGLGEARWIKAETGMFGVSLWDAVREADPDALACLVVLAMRRAGETEASLEKVCEEANGYVDLLFSMKIDGKDPAAYGDRTTPAPTNRAARRAAPKKPVAVDA